MANVKSSSISNYFKKIKCTESKDMYLQNEFLKKHDLTNYCLHEANFKSKDTNKLKVKDVKRYSMPTVTNIRQSRLKIKNC